MSKELPYTVSKEPCPRCGGYTMREPQEFNALSRTDNKTYICSNCGTLEALEDYYRGGYLTQDKWFSSQIASVAKMIKEIGEASVCD